eukprot:g33519.t1
MKRADEAETTVSDGLTRLGELAPCSVRWMRRALALVVLWDAMEKWHLVRQSGKKGKSMGLACKLCTTLLQKQPANSLVRALHAVALERCGRRDEAIRLCQDTVTAGIAAEKNVVAAMDDTCVNTLQARCGPATR